MMRRFVASNPDVEVKSSLISSFFNSVKYEEIRPFIQHYNLDELSDKEWHPQQKLLDLFRDISENKINVSENLVSVGMKVVETAAFPPTINSVESALEGLRIAYNLDHRNHTEKGWIVEIILPGKAIMIADNPYPADQHYGLLWALMRRFKPHNTEFSVSQKPLANPDDNPVFELNWWDPSQRDQ
jgi:hypothetical protein